MTLAELIEKALREHLRIRPQQNAIALLNAGDAIMLSGTEAEDAARIMLDALAGAGMVVVWDTSCTRHARLLDECRRQEERAEKAELALRQALPQITSGQYWRAEEIIGATLDGAEEGDRG